MNIFKKWKEMDPERGFYKRKFKKYKESAQGTKEKGSNALKSAGKYVTETLSQDYRNIDLEKVKTLDKAVSAFRFLLTILAVLGIIFSFVRIVTVSGPSMNNTYHDGQVITIDVNKKINKQDVVVFLSTNETYGNDYEYIIKRVIATAGDTVEIKNNTVYVNNKPLKEDYALGKTSNYKKTTIEENKIFVLGDNRENSMDSRDVGQISLEQVIGKVN